MHGDGEGRGGPEVRCRGTEGGVAGTEGKKMFSKSTFAREKTTIFEMIGILKGRTDEMLSPVLNFLRRLFSSAPWVNKRVYFAHQVFVFDAVGNHDCDGF